MTKRSLFIASLFLLLSTPVWMKMTVAVGFAETNEPQKTCTTSQCHSRLMPPSPSVPKEHEDCTHCHKSKTTTKHPQPGVATFNVSKEVCQECHPTVVDYDYLHTPVAAGDCQACHALHGPSPSLLKNEEEQSLCYRCHRPVTKEGDTVLHGDVANKKCSSCHTVHGSFYRHLLTGSYSTDFFNDFTEKRYAFCFQCHKIDLLLHEFTSYNTNFRDGKQNLHYLHVNRDTRGRACKLCHEIHSSRHPKLMADTVTFGGWQMPINFIPTESGGRCTPGCHAPATYDRNKVSTSAPLKKDAAPDAKDKETEN